MSIEFKAFLRLFIKNLIIELINFELKKNKEISNEDRERIQKSIYSKLDSMVEEIMKALENDNLIAPNALKDDVKAKKIFEIVRRELKRKIGE